MPESVPTKYCDCWECSNTVWDCDSEFDRNKKRGDSFDFMRDYYQKTNRYLHYSKYRYLGSMNSCVFWVGRDNINTEGMIPQDWYTYTKRLSNLIEIVKTFTDEQNESFKSVVEGLSNRPGGSHYTTYTNFEMLLNYIFGKNQYLDISLKYLNIINRLFKNEDIDIKNSIFLLEKHGYKIIKDQ